MHWSFRIGLSVCLKNVKPREMVDSFYFPCKPNRVQAQRCPKITSNSCHPHQLCYDEFVALNPLIVNEIPRSLSLAELHE